MASKSLSSLNELGRNILPGDPQVVAEVPTAIDRRDAGWDVRHGPKNYVALVGAQAVSALFSLAAVWIATRYLGAGGYGRVVAIIAASQCVAQLAVHWTAVSLSRYGCEEFVETGKIARTFWTRLLILVLNLLIVTATFPLWLPLLSSWLRIPPQAYPLVLGHLLASVLWIHVQQGLLGAKLLRLQGGLLAVERALVFLILVTLAFGGKASVVSMTLAYVVAPLGASAIGLSRLRSLLFPILLDRSLLKRMLIFSLPLIPYSLIGYLSTNYLDALFITRFLSVAELGIYAVVYQMSGTMMQLPLLAGSLMLPFFVTLQVTGRDSGAIRFLREVLPLASLLWSIGCALVAAIGGSLVPLIFGAQFREAPNVLWPLLAASALAGPVLMGYGPISNARAATYIVALASAVSAALNVIFNLLLIPRFGLTGCAWATAIAYAGCAVTAAFLVHLRVTRNRGWSLQASLPALVGAALYVWQNSQLEALIAALLTAALLAMLYHRDVVAGFHLLRERGHFSVNAPEADIVQKHEAQRGRQSDEEL